MRYFVGLIWLFGFWGLCVQNQSLIVIIMLSIIHGCDVEY